jgi:hypothetical protein
VSAKVGKSALAILVSRDGINIESESVTSAQRAAGVRSTLLMAAVTFAEDVVITDLCIDKATNNHISYAKILYS